MTSALLADAAERKPNFVVIVADDLGYADVGYHGANSGIETPRIDELAHSGIRFKNGYSNGAVCTPTRAALLTGRYQNRVGCDTTIAPYKRADAAPLGLPTDAATLAERLKPLGYATGMFGKWHLGGEVEESWELDGVDLMPFLTGKQTGRPHETLFWKSGRDLAVRHHDWKLLRQYGKTFLFNLTDDPGEEENLSTQRPEIARDLMENWAAWNEENVPPNYGWALKKSGIHVKRVPR